MDDSQDDHQPEVRITPRLVDGFYTEAMLLADEARAYFDDAGRVDRNMLEPFARGHGATAEGTGLGLAIVAQQVGLHGGELRLADSELGGLAAEVGLPARA